MSMESLLKSQSFVAAERAYCLISRYPLFEVHFEILLSFLARERAFRFSSTQKTESASVEELKQILDIDTKRSSKEKVQLKVELYRFGLLLFFQF